MNNTTSFEIRFVYENEKYVLDKDPFKSDKGYFYLPDGRLGWAESIRCLEEGRIRIVNEPPYAKAKIVRAFTTRMNGFDVEFENGFPFRIWLSRNNSKETNQSDLSGSQTSAQKLMNGCGFEVRVGEFQINDIEKRIYYAPCADLRNNKNSNGRLCFNGCTCLKGAKHLIEEDSPVSSGPHSDPWSGSDHSQRR